MPDPRDWHIIYSNNEGFITVTTKQGASTRTSVVWPLDNSGHGAVDLKHRFQWVSPLLLSPHNPDAIYTAGEGVFKSTDHGHSWTAISEDLTRNDKSKQKPSGGPIQTTSPVEYYDTIFALAESPLKKGMLWAGTDDGLIHVTTDDGQHWAKSRRTCRNGAPSALIDPSPSMRTPPMSRSIVIGSMISSPTFSKRQISAKIGRAITNGIPDGAYVHAVREDPRRGLLYAGTELGVFVSFDDGAHWQSLQLNLPVSPIHDLVVKDDDLVVATHGRSFWVLDDLTPLRQVNAQSRTPT